MAADSCENDLPPTEFNFSSSFESEEGLKIAVERCPLCCRTGRPFYCSNCVNSGIFAYSKPSVPERYFTFERNPLALLSIR